MKRREKNEIDRNLKKKKKNNKKRWKSCFVAGIVISNLCQKSFIKTK